LEQLLLQWGVWHRPLFPVTQERLGAVSGGNPAGGIFDQSVIPCNPPYAGDRGHVDPPTGFTAGAATTTIDIHWWVDANCSEAFYLLDVFIEGPIGVPFE